MSSSDPRIDEYIEKSKDFAKLLEKSLKTDKSKKHEFIGAVELGTNLSGVKLLQEGLKTDLSIAKYLGAVVEERGGDWAQRDFANTYYMWISPQTKAQMPSKNRKGDKNLNFDSYNQFITP